ncbi:Uncharacterised protein [Chlamydia trachomatis]|nr:Uncharacterised protein [Chlamydia trachomatis]
MPNGCFAATSSIYFLISSSLLFSVSSPCSTFSVSTLIVGFFTVIVSSLSTLASLSNLLMSLTGSDISVEFSTVVFSC